MNLAEIAMIDNTTSPTQYHCEGIRLGKGCRRVLNESRGSARSLC